MNNDTILARLLAQAAEAQPAGDLVTLRALVEEASELGADRALAKMGLDDARAVDDMRELRQLLQAWRDAKASAWQAAVAWVVRGALALLVLGMAWRRGVPDLLKTGLLK